MSRVVFHQFEDAVQSLPAYELRFVPVRQTVVEFPIHKDLIETQDSSLARPGCIRGIRSALAIEAAAALMVYGLWQLMHLLR